MRRVILFFVCFGVIFCGYQSISFAAKGSLEYLVSMPNPHTHYFEVEIHLKDYSADFVDFKLPVWTPGSYLIREYAKNVEGFNVFNKAGGAPLPFEKTSKNCWRVNLGKDKDIYIKYRVYAFEGLVRMSYLDEDHAFIMPNTLLMYVDEAKESSSVLRLSYPERWGSISTSLSEIKGLDKAFYVPNYDILVDSPIEIGNHQIIKFEASKVPHEIAMVGKVNFDEKQLVRDLTKIIASATSVFEENPNEKYTFIIQTDKRSGGLEHMSSSVLGVDRWAFSNQRSYNYFLSLAAHEYFHLWLVKRLKPVELEKLDYEKEVYTDLLWVMEGFTSYFEEKIMLDCGFYSEQKFINNILSALATIRNTPGASEQSVAEASFDAWVKYYRRNENSENNQISYYSKGMLLGALLDLEIIAGSDGTKTLDDVINFLYYEFYKKRGKGIESDDLKKAAENASNKDLSDFFNNYVYGTEILGHEPYLLSAGIKVVETNGTTNSKSIGIKYSQENNGLIIKSIKKGSSAYENGLNVGDELISLNGYRLNYSNFHTILNDYQVGDVITVLIGRKGIIVEKELDIRHDKTVNYTYEQVKDRTKHQIRTYNTWLVK